MLPRILCTLLLLAPAVFASSRHPPPLDPRALSTPQDLKVLIVPRRLDAHSIKRSYSSNPTDPAWDDRFLLSFSSHDRPVVLSLRPAAHLVHPKGIKLVDTHTDERGERTTKTRWIQREEVRAYEGWVLDPTDDPELWMKEETAGVRREEGVRGIARIVLSDTKVEEEEEGGVLFQGTFTAGGELFTVHPTASYLRTKQNLDPDPPLVLRKRGIEGTSYAYPNLVIIRERAILSPGEHLATLRRRGLAVPSWLESDRASSQESSCGHDHLAFNMDPAHPVYEAALIDSLSSPWLTTVFGMPARGREGYPLRVAHVVKRQGDISGSSNMSSNFINSIGSTVGCPKSQQVLFVGAALDCTYVAHYTSADLARTQVLTDFNSASSVYQSSFNISLGLVELNVQSGACPTTTAQVDSSNPWNVGCLEGGGPGLDLNDRLSTFSAWRGAKGGSDGAGHWHLLTNCSSGSEVGVSWLGQLCRVEASSSDGQSTSGTAVTAVTRTEAQVVMHEIGHSFGAIHDCTTGCTLENSNPVCCPLTTSSCDASANFIMSPVSEKNVTSFSPCSIGNICSSLSSSLNTTCLATPGAVGNPSIISLKSCGNGIVETGEECDPGNAVDPCCDAATCQFASGAVCSPLNSLCCTNSCQTASAGTICRASVDPRCDKSEVCAGNNATCPADSFVSDGTSCGSNGLACATGVCTSRTLQCATEGASLNLTSACPARDSNSCSITCQDPTSSSHCIVLQESFRSGTPCGYAGTCENSVCVSGSALNVAKSWYRQNLQIAIPVTVVAAVLFIVIIIALWRCCARSRRQATAPARGAPSARYGGASAPPPPRSSGGGGRRLVAGGGRRSGSGGGASLKPPVMRNSADSSGINSTSSQATRPLFVPPVEPAMPPPGYWGGPTYQQHGYQQEYQQPQGRPSRRDRSGPGGGQMYAPPGGAPWEQEGYRG